MKKELVLDGLDCANCAAKIEDTVKKHVDNVELNFITKTLSFNVKDENKIEEIKEIIKKIEPDVNVYEKNNSNKESSKKSEFSKKNEFIRLISAISIFIAAIFIKNPFWLQLILYIIAYLISGCNVLLKTFKNRGNFFDENFLMSIATIGAFSIGEYPEAVGVMLFYELGEFLQNMAVDNSKRSIKALLDIRPDYAYLLKDNKEIKVSPEEVKKGDLIVVKPGDRVPLDGIVVKGSSMLDVSALTGESVPVTIKENEEVNSGVININGVLTIKVEKEYYESTVSKILDMVENAAAKKAKTEKLITKFAKYYTPIIVFSAIFLAILPPFILGESFKDWLYRALIFLVISCPCGLVVSIPLGYFAGVGALSKKGVLVKGGNYLERFKNLDTIIFDKTGTLTEGVFEVVEFSNNDVLKIAAQAEYYSNHPIAESIKRKYGKEIINNIEDYEEISGHGIRAKIEGKEVLVGNRKLMKNIEIPEIDFNGTLVFVAINGEFAGYIVISDKLKRGIKDTIKNIKDLGVRKTIMLTGDNKKVAEAVAKEIKIDEYYAELLPEDKLEYFEKEKKYSENIAFIGDGINDAPGLTRADVGVAMGGLGSDAAIEAADVIIMDDDVSKLIDAIKISRKTLKIIWQNIIFVLGIKISFLTLGAFGKTDMWGAIFADVGVTLIAVFNTLRILKNE
ncbi:heavy metal translocating P-type ATPase [Marinitoga sp. 38H-ov]|uniref:heavy metal translocating P-type ATPase n=1 Tax=Marinitoga sp. 38H-ov TaxID=1755814 RepID=UPI0019D0C258|nr:heavy metal translocating P-type ATPase [Marinitoga sp. 38H-ov]